MFADEEKAKKVEVEDNEDNYEDFDYDKYLDDDYGEDDDTTEEQQETKEKEEVQDAEVEKQEKKQEKVGIEDPKEGIKFEPSLENITILLSLVGIGLVFLARMFSTIPLTICFTIFYWIGAAVVIGAIAVYLTQIIKAKKVKFEPQLVILILSIFCCL